MPHPSSRSPVSIRPQARPFHEYVAQQQRVLASCRTNADKTLADGPRLWRQMVIGFTCAGFVGLIMLVLGSVFIAEAVGNQQSIIVMLCVMGIVFGVIIVMGAFVLGKLLIPHKSFRCQNERTSVSASQCFHTCSVTYNHSLDQLGTSESVVDSPPAYDSVISFAVHPVSGPPAADHHRHLQDHDSMSVMTLPPKYDEVAEPLPQYMETFK